MPILGFRGRLFAYAGAAVGLALGSPRFGGSLLDFLATPTGLGFGGGVLVCVGLSVEESGTLARIRAGILLRLLGPVVLAAATAWSFTQGVSPGFVYLVGAAFVGVAAARDVALLRDLRVGQATRLEALDAGRLLLSVQGAPVIIPLDAIDHASVARVGDGRGVVLALGRRDRVQGEEAKLPWLSSDLTRDALVLTEHQCNKDARTVVEEIARAASRGGKKYR